MDALVQGEIAAQLLQQPSNQASSSGSSSSAAAASSQPAAAASTTEPADDATVPNSRRQPRYRQYIAEYKEQIQAAAETPPSKDSPYGVTDLMLNVFWQLPQLHTNWRVASDQLPFPSGKLPDGFTAACMTLIPKFQPLYAQRFAVWQMLRTCAIGMGAMPILLAVPNMGGAPSVLQLSSAAAAMGPYLYNSAASESGDWLLTDCDPLTEDERLIMVEFAIDTGAAYAYRDVLRGFRPNLEGLLARVDNLTVDLAAVAAGLTPGTRVSQQQQGKVQGVQEGLLSLKSALLGFLGTSSSDAAMGAIYTAEARAPDTGIDPNVRTTNQMAQGSFNNVVIRSGRTTSALLHRALDLTMALHADTFEKEEANRQAINDAMRALQGACPIKVDYNALATLRRLHSQGYPVPYCAPSATKR